MLHRLAIPLCMSMDPDSPLNRAHQRERKAEKMLNNGHYDLALQCYREASEYVQQAMRKTKDTAALHSLRLQKDNYDKMPTIVNKKRQHGQQKLNPESLALNLRGPADEAKDEGVDVEEEDKEDETDMSQSVGVNRLLSVEPDTNGNLLVADQPDSFESLPSTASEDTDSLLQFLNQHSSLDGKQQTYRPSLILRAFENRNVVPPKQDLDQNTAVANAPLGRKMAKDDGVRLEELQIQNAELQKHVVNLLAQLESCVQENKSLKSTVSELKCKLETHRSRAASMLQAQPDFRGSFDMPPFSLHTSFDSLPAPASHIMVPQTPPALPPLEMPNFDEQ